MTNIKARILMNIRSEVRNNLRHGDELPTRDPVWAEDVARILKEEAILLQEYMEVTYYRPFYAKYDGKMPYPYPEWLRIANSLYTVVGCTLISKAKGPDHLREWKLESHQACHKKKLVLIRTKHYDHFIKGFGFMHIPEEVEP